ncbi:ORF6N domain-containing protein [Arsenophonus nasoniae]|uniref:ORF6N domain-containing protein n=1 Tax=Arsenophonus nasoniae TaxID=638 RepID=A0AA95GJT0_9GAMM|nr:ORF6N domain-containing protein [Arsenophonus nasoniae]WGM00252.1 ORF6N domain-containing protein [Arsenophonus nasoniae]WGM00546.1 ORF6N domain-containing protein [Arsenophonus nasoniae]
MKSELITIDSNQLPVIEWQNVRVVTTETLASGYGTEASNIRMNLSNNKSRFIEGIHYFNVTGEALAHLRVNNIYAQISNKARAITLYTEKGAARMSKIVDTDEAWSFFEKMESAYFNQKSLPSDPTTLGLPNFLDPAESAIAWAEQHKKVQLLGVQVQQLETENDCLKNLFKEGMTPTQFSKMLNGVNSQQINHFLAGLKWLYNESKSGNNLRWRVAATARDKYLTEKQNEISPHGANSFISYRPVLLRKGAQRLYDQYLADKLPMKKNWNGLHTHDKTIQIVA